MDVSGDGMVAISGSDSPQGAVAPPAAAPSAPAPAPATPAEASPHADVFPEIGGEDVINTPPSPALRVRFGDREHTIEEAQAEYEKAMNRLKNADRTTAAYRQRAEQAIAAAQNMQGILRQAGMLSEDGQMVVKSPEEIRARIQNEAQEPEYKFELPNFIELGESKEQQAAFWEAVESISAERGLRYGLALIMDRVNNGMKQFWERLSGEKGYLARQFDGKLAPMQPFFQHLEATGQRAQFLSAMQQQIGEDGTPTYPELRDRGLVTRLTYIMDEQPDEWRHTPQGFAQAINALRWQVYRESQAAPAGEGSGVTPQPPPQAPRPPNVVVMDKGAPSGIPRPRPQGAAPAADDGSRLLRKRGVAGGIQWT